MGATAAITISCTASGLPEGGVDQMNYVMVNTSADNTVRSVAVSTALAAATPLSLNSSARFCILIPPATNTLDWRLSGSTAELGIAVSSNGAQVISGAGSNCQIVAWTTSGTAFSLRAITY